jgi:hypothetical protein
MNLLLQEENISHETKVHIVEDKFEAQNLVVLSL